MEVKNNSVVIYIWSRINSSGLNKEMYMFSMYSNCDSSLCVCVYMLVPHTLASRLSAGIWWWSWWMLTCARSFRWSWTTRDSHTCFIRCSAASNTYTLLASYTGYTYTHSQTVQSFIFISSSNKHRHCIAIFQSLMNWSTLNIYKIYIKYNKLSFCESTRKTDALLLSVEFEFYHVVKLITCAGVFKLSMLRTPKQDDHLQETIFYKPFYTFNTKLMLSIE